MFPEVTIAYLLNSSRVNSRKKEFEQNVAISQYLSSSASSFGKLAKDDKTDSLREWTKNFFASMPVDDYDAKTQQTNSQEITTSDVIKRLGIENSNYEKIVSAICELMQVDPEEDIQPTENALKQSLAILDQLQQALTNHLPPATASVDVNGGIEIYWRKPGCKVFLIIAPQETSPVKLYHQLGDSYAVISNVTAGQTAEWLRWFIAI